MKRSDYLEVGDISRREAREIVAISGPSFVYLLLVSLFSLLLGLLGEKLLLVAFAIYVLFYPPLRLLAPHRSVTLAFLIPRSAIRAYFLLQGATIIEVTIDYTSVFRVALVNEKIKI